MIRRRSLMRMSTKLVVFVAFFLSVLSFSFSLCPGGELIPPTRTLSDTGKPPGKLTVSSDPPGLAVLLDGTLIGKTPVWLSDLKPGLHTLRVNHSETEIYVQQNRTLHLTLFRGTLISFLKEIRERPTRPDAVKDQLIETRTAMEPHKEHKQGDLTPWERFINRSSRHF